MSASAQNRVGGLQPLQPAPESGLQPLAFRATLLTGVGGAACFLTTGFAPDLAIAVMVGGLLLTAWGGPVRMMRHLAPLGSLGFLVRAVTLFRAGTPGIVALTEYACGVMAMQWLIMEEVGAARRALVLAGMIVLAVAAMSVNFLFPLALAPFVACLLGALILLADRPEEAPALAGGLSRWNGRSPALRSLGFWGVLVRGGLIFLIFWIGLFYLIPRPDVLGIASGAAKRRLRGFSETLRLGETGTLEDNPMVVMRVQPVVSETRHRRMLQFLQNTALRGCSFARYERGSWSRSVYRSRGLNLRRLGGESVIQSYPDDPRPELDLEIIRESVEPSILFLPAQTMILRSTIPFLWVDSDGALGIPPRRGGVEVYQCRIKLGPPLIRDTSLASATFPAMTQIFLDTGDSGGAIQDLAQEATVGAGTIHQTVQAIMLFLARNYTYSLAGATENIRDPVSHFLVSQKEGNCEHFASAMVLMLRNLGIPARPVNGYLLTEWNDYGGFFTVRQRDAHSWVEVYFPGQGWVPFDPTPARNPVEPSFLNRWLGGVGAWERFEGLWFNFVYRFDRDLQIAGFRKLYQTWFGMLIAGLKSGWWLLGGAFLLAVGILFARRHRRHGGGVAGIWLPDWYRTWEASLPLRREDWETPREFHRRLLAEGLWPPALASTLAALETEIGRAVFGGEARDAAARAVPLLRALDADFRSPSGTGHSGTHAGGAG